MKLSSELQVKIHLPIIVYVHDNHYEAQEMKSVKVNVVFPHYFNNCKRMAIITAATHDVRWHHELYQLC